MAESNKYGLSRTIPEEVKRQVRQRSRFGCVMCRSGITHYEHFEPEFKDAKTHAAEGICCLCASCHDKVTRRIYSKQMVAKAYALVQGARGIEPPKDFFDFHSGEALMLLGNLYEAPAPNFVFRVYGEDVFRLAPGKPGAEGALYAKFKDEIGGASLTIEGNQWVASVDSWDVKITGQRITVHSASGLHVLTLRVSPPGKIVIEHLDMRFGPAHLMATEHAFIMGHYCQTPGLAAWITAYLSITEVTTESVALSVHAPNRNNKGSSVGTIGGAEWAEAGLSVAKGCSFNLSELVTGLKSVDHVRHYFFDCAASPGLPKLIQGNHFLLLEDTFKR